MSTSQKPPVRAQINGFPCRLSGHRDDCQRLFPVRTEASVEGIGYYGYSFNGCWVRFLLPTLSFGACKAHIYAGTVLCSLFASPGHITVPTWLNSHNCGRQRGREKGSWAEVILKSQVMRPVRPSPFVRIKIHTKSLKKIHINFTLVNVHLKGQ